MLSKLDEMLSVAIFCPQSKAPQKSYLDRLHSFLSRNAFLKHFVQDIKDLPKTWQTFASQREDIAALEQGPRYMKYMSEWITTGESEPIANAMSGTLSLPLLVIIQSGQYFQFLELNGIKHLEFLTMRIALGIVAYGELGDDENIPGPTTIVIRLKSIGQGEDIVEKFPGAHISAVTDPKTISMVGSVPVLAKVQAYAREKGLLVQEMHLRGKVHNSENAKLAKGLCNLCDKIHFLQLPPASAIQAPMRSNKTGNMLEHESLSHEAVETILASRCEWGCVPLVPFHKRSLRITKLDILDAINKAVPPVPTSRGKTHYSSPSDAVAVVGASRRLPGANNLEEL
ncbi:hypothetical protein EAF04_005933 [Stromatinia cepivora]|nr:hypothetical protein EAF04_005933 [Stromatinia cepivora]